MVYSPNISLSPFAVAFNSVTRCLQLVVYNYDPTNTAYVRHWVQGNRGFTGVFNMDDTSVHVCVSVSSLMSHYPH